MTEKKAAGKKKSTQPKKPKPHFNKDDFKGQSFTIGDGLFQVVSLTPGGKLHAQYIGTAAVEKTSFD